MVPDYKLEAPMYNVGEEYYLRSVKLNATAFHILVTNGPRQYHVYLEACTLCSI